jgi:uncharacterized protein (TIGR01619 family)
MADNWKPYLCRVNGSVASIMVDLALRHEAPLASKPWLLWVWAYFKMPRPDGLSDGQEAPILYEIEDALTHRALETCKALLCGRITTSGRREFYLYGQTPNRFQEAVESAMKTFEGYKYDFGTREDPAWSHYLDVLYPGPEDLQRIKNEEVLEVLAEKGDALTLAREVQHWIYFRSEYSRANFQDAATAAGFAVVSVSRSEGAFPFGIVLSKQQPVEQDRIDDTTIELLHLADRFGGDYDGWETQVITQ